MSYRIDRKTKRRKIEGIIACLLLLFLIIYFRNGLWRGLSFAAQATFRPVFILGENLGSKFSDLGAYFHSKKILRQDNEYMKFQLSEEANRMSNYNTLLSENEKLKEILNRIGEKRNLILASILAKPNHSLYDTLIIDVGSKQGIIAGQKVFALGDIPIGYIAEIYPGSSKVVLFSNPKERTMVIVSLGRSRTGEAGKDIFLEAVGRGGGNFEMTLPRDFSLEPGTEVILPGIFPQVLAKVATIISDPRDSFQKALLTSPVNIFELKFVEVEN